MDAKQLGPFRMIRQIGRGGMGAVYEAEHIETHIPAAVKVLLEPVDEEDSELRNRFEVEIETLKRLRHPNIVRLFGFGQEEGQLFYAMEYVEGPSLQDLLSQKYSFSYEQVLHVGIGIASALRHAHDRGIIHRDIKPANILLPEDGTVKVSDYGIAHFFGGSRLTDANMVIGTIEYMAPEQAEAGPLTPKSDLYSLGALLYALLAGKPPYSARSLPEILQKYRSGPPESIRFKRPDVPKAFDQILLDLLRVKSEDRPANAMLLLRRLESLRSPLLSGTNLFDSLPKPAVRPPQKKPLTPQTPNPPSMSSIDLEQPTLNLDAASEQKNEERQNIDFDLDVDQTASIESIPVTAELRQHPLNGKSTDFDLSGWPPKSSGRGQNSQGTTLPTGVLDELRPADQSILIEVENETKVPPKDLTPPGPPDRLPPEKNIPLSIKGNAADSLQRTDRLDQQKQAISSAVSDEVPLEANYSSRSSVTGTTTKQSHFTMVPEEELGRFHDDEPQTSPYVSVKIWIFSLTLIMIGVFFWYVLRAPSADSLYSDIQERIERNVDKNGYLGALRSSEKKLLRFLSLYPGDLRSEKIRGYLNDLELGNLERRLERQLNNRMNDRTLSAVEYAYLDAMREIERNPEAGIQKMEDFIILFDRSPHQMNSQDIKTDPDEENIPQKGIDRTIPGQCVTLAKRQLEQVKKQIQQNQSRQQEFLTSLLEQIEQLAEQQPERAEATRQALLRFYGDKTWAEPILQPVRNPDASDSSPLPDSIQEK